jgi:hypothetical protein
MPDYSVLRLGNKRSKANPRGITLMCSYPTPIYMNSTNQIEPVEWRNSGARLNLGELRSQRALAGVHLGQIGSGLVTSRERPATCQITRNVSHSISDDT